ncbi:glycosyltransferase [Paenibacillus humicola]|uniref:glycosyltransferase n=1 Tax=Paenibacillus humicola TaxID=3110540 RepID=UPI00237A4B8D|nr:glycosyltransferase [Paenibacillus humicola]
MKQKSRPARRVTTTKTVNHTIQVQDNIQLSGKPMIVKLPAPDERLLSNEYSVLLVIDQFNVGGTETHTLGLARELMKNGVHVAIAGKSGRMLDSFVALGCPVYTMDFVTDTFEYNAQTESELIDHLKAIIREENIGLLHAHQFPSGKIAVQAAKEMNIPIVFTVHLTMIDGDLIRLLDDCDEVIAISSSAAAKLQQWNIPATLLTNGIDLKEFALSRATRPFVRSSLGLPEEGPIVTYAARLSFEKADISLAVIEACRQLVMTDYPALRLVIIGGGRQNTQVRERVSAIHKEMDGKFVLMPGEVLHLRPYYSSSDCFIGTGRTALEALACECQTIVAGAKGYLGFMHNKQQYDKAWDTWFCDHGPGSPCTVDAFETDIRKVLSLSPRQKEDLGWVGRKFVKERYDVVDRIPELLSIYARYMKTQPLLDE